MNSHSSSRTKFGNTQFSDQAQSFNTLPTHPVELEKYQVNDILISYDNTLRFEHHIMYPLLLKLLDHRDSLYFDTNLNELLSRTKKLSNELSKFINLSDVNVNSDIDKEIRSCISTVASQIVEKCNNEKEFTGEFLKFHSEFEKKLTIFSQKHHEEQLNSDLMINKLNKLITEEKKTTRQNMDPMAVLWFIKYLIDHKLEKPNKKHRFLLSLWTNVPEHDIDRWFIRTMGNYVKKLNDVEKTREKLKERAINTTRQLRKPNSFKTNSESRQATSQRNSPYKRPTRGRKEKIKQ
uniref:HD1-like protein n=1 Tax=Rhizophagus clarus TaxID=94130 RepID=A0A141TLJ5_9GLOM|nr:HD1-like protein [Rhizophagus clarus]AMP19729.1 HD1-like protein [Rhizophagus clarus]